jgi:hypothetical protein
LPIGIARVHQHRFFADEPADDQIDPMARGTKWRGLKVGSSLLDDRKWFFSLSWTWRFREVFANEPA